MCPKLSSWCYFKSIAPTILPNSIKGTPFFSCLGQKQSQQWHNSFSLIPYVISQQPLPRIPSLPLVMASGTTTSQLGPAAALNWASLLHSCNLPASPQSIRITAAPTENHLTSLLKSYQFPFISLKAKILTITTALISFLLLYPSLTASLLLPFQQDRHKPASRSLRLLFPLPRTLFPKYL